MSGNKPDYYVGCLDTETERKNPRLGAAWINNDGTISIKLDDFVTVTGSKSTYLRLFPNRDRSQAKPQTPEAATKAYTTTDLQEDIPF